MAGTREGGLRAAQTNKERHGNDFYTKIGTSGGKKSTGGGWKWLKENDPERFLELSSRGGKGRNK